MPVPGPALTARYAEVFRRAQRHPVRIYRLMHDVLHCQMDLAVTLADAAEAKWRNAHAGIPTTIVVDWLDLRPGTVPPDPPPTPKRTRRTLTVVRRRARARRLHPRGDVPGRSLGDCVSPCTRRA